MSYILKLNIDSCIKKRYRLTGANNIIHIEDISIRERGGMLKRI